MDPKALADAKDALAKGTATEEQKALVKAEKDSQFQKPGSPRPNLETFLEPFIAESAPKLPSGSI
jgi:hypothetical protein